MSRAETLRVLVVDDHVDERDLYTFALTRQGVEVATVGTADEAIASIASAEPDVIVSDICLPGADGYELIRKVRSRGVDRDDPIPAIAVTGWAGEEARRRAIMAGFQAHLAKPVSLTELTETIMRLARLRHEARSLREHLAAKSAAQRALRRQLGQRRPELKLQRERVRSQRTRLISQSPFIERRAVGAARAFVLDLLEDAYILDARAIGSLTGETDEVELWTVEVTATAPSWARHEESGSTEARQTLLVEVEAGEEVSVRAFRHIL
jgi:CheY-like chemotaxis protein